MRDLAEIEDVEALRDTGKAVLCRTQDGREVWVPQSQIADESEVWRQGDAGTLVIPRWLAVARGLVDE